MSIYDKYQAVIGLEVHAQLLTRTKAFSSDPTDYGSPPNTQVNPISMGHPGTLPRYNKKALEYAVRMGLACGSSIRRENIFARKNYFYADLPKGYQISQFDTPLCDGGFVEIETDEGLKKIGVTRIHVEEDSGKSIHDIDPYYTLIDLNRAGVPLIEIVSEPDMRTGDDAYQYLTKIRKLVRYLDICDGNMEEGSLRCDANISVMPKGSDTFGQKVEVKNMNSIRNVKRAIEHEIKRQIEAVENGEPILQETRTFDAVSGTTSVMRVKEGADDYRYFPEPDLPPLIVEEEYVNGVKTAMPPLPRQLQRKFMESFRLSDYDARVLTDEKEVALYFDDLTTKTKNYKAAANWVMGPVKSYLNQNAVDMDDFPIPSDAIAELIALIDDGKISNSIAEQRLFPELLKKPDIQPSQLAEALNLIQQSDVGVINSLIDEALEQYPDKVEAYRGGQKGLLGFFMGQIMKASKGKADPKKTSSILKEKLEA